MATKTHRKLMTTLSLCGVSNEERAEIIYNYTMGRTSSSRELTENEMEALTILMKSERDKKMDQKRKKVIRIIFSVHEKMNRKVTMDYVKAVACRAAEAKTFNKISENKLDAVYNAFRAREKSLEVSGRIIEGHINEQISYN